ncbi:hypothetical protein OIU74_027708 [Salix koriyanagi]|uniref:Uncharacterized protein n=1 Tax=Salix koriyanagi TaxID=2511006 RepID=A0A9Q0VSU1_9ROSI|nr:hypothetical protein OIU74_027708 [Salix koriyanagi]
MDNGIYNEILQKRCKQLLHFDQEAPPFPGAGMIGFRVSECLMSVGEENFDSTFKHQEHNICSLNETTLLNLR